MPNTLRIGADGGTNVECLLRRSTAFSSAPHACTMTSLPQALDSRQKISQSEYRTLKDAEVGHALSGILGVGMGVPEDSGLNSEEIIEH